MDADQIARALNKATEPAELIRLIRACAPRRVEIRDRIAQIAPGIPGISVPAERAGANRKGPDAAKALDDEIERLQREDWHLDILERECNVAHEVALTERAVKAIPVAKRKLPGAIERVRASLAELDMRLAELREVVETIGEYQRLPNRAFPLSDDELADLLQLREQVWAARSPAVLRPPGLSGHPDEPGREAFAKSAAIFWTVRTGKFGGSYHETPAPKRIHLPDFAQAVYR